MIWGLPKKALITGASSGIGKEVAKELFSQGVELFLVGRNRDRLEDSAGTPIVADLLQKQDRHIVLEAIKQYDIDCVINSAGLGYYGTESDSEMEEIIKVNIEALVIITRTATQYWMEQKKQGVVLNVASALAFVPAPYFSIYAASKAFVVSFSRAENYIYSRYGIYVLSSCPGKVATDFQRRASREQQKNFLSPMVMEPKKAAEAIVKQIRLRREVFVFDWRTRVLIFIGRLFPHFAMKIIYKTFKSKIW